MHVVVTGSAGFIGRHLMLALSSRPDTTVIGRDVQDDAASLIAAVRDADVIVHAAGVNRPQSEDEFRTGNTDLTKAVCDAASAGGRRPLVVLTSSIQAAGDSPYGTSKRDAEAVVTAWAAAGHGRGVVLRLANVFGKWCRPNYNSAAATFCHAIANGLPFHVSDPAREVPLLCVDDIVAAVLRHVDAPPAVGTTQHESPGPVVPITLGNLVSTLEGFRDSRTTLRIPDFSTRFIQQLYATYLSYLAPDNFGYDLPTNHDPRGFLAEVVKQSSFGQIFVSRTRPGITRGNHWHHTKTEKFLVVEGEAVIRFRRIDGEDVIEERVSGAAYRVVDIPPGYTHSIENIGTTDMVCLFWASEIFDRDRPDTHPEAVLRA
ncbi:MAG: NAD-dependent epimerase/dehydratase family protein [bacterium]